MKPNPGFRRAALGRCWLACLSLTIAASARSGEEMPLDIQPPESISQGWGTLKTRTSVSGAPLTIAGRVFTRGFGTHAASDLRFGLEDGCEGFSAWVGVDDALKNHPDAGKASVVFQVMGDGKLLFDSGVMRMGDPAKRVQVDVKGLETLRLLVNDAGDGISCDHANWADPVLTGGEPRAVPPPKHRITADGLTLLLNERGGIAGCPEIQFDAEVRLAGFRDTGAADSSALPGGGHSFTRVVADRRGRSATILECFSPEGEGIRWEVAITSTNACWSTPLRVRLRCATPENRLIWAPWGSPDFSGAELSPELTALVQAGKAAVGGPWSDPLIPTGFPDRKWNYGNVMQACPVGDDYIVLPLVTIMDPLRDAGLSLVLSPDDVLLDLDLQTSTGGLVQFQHARHRFGEGVTRRFTMHLRRHEASWRGGLRFLTGTYPGVFNPPNPRAHLIAGCGAYSICEDPIDVAKFKAMAFGFNWKLSDDFPYMGMFLPPLKSADEIWKRSGAEPCPPGKGPDTSARRMNDYARYMKANGFSVLSYFNVTEFGRHVNPAPAGPPPGRADDPELWRDCSAFMKAKLPEAWLRIAEAEATEWGARALGNGQKGLMSNCYGAAIVDPGDPAYLEFMLEQAARNTRWLPDTDGVCIDRTDWLRFYNINGDDGVSWSHGRPSRSLYRSWASLMSRFGPLLHQADKVIFSNMMTMRLELCRELDGIYTEFGNNGNALNGSALLGLRKPVVAWTYNETLRQPGPDAFMQRHLHLGVFPTAPYPYNNHCINPEPSADRLYAEYGPLLSAMRGKKWVLTPACVEAVSTGVKVNLFEVPGGYALPVTFGGDRPSAEVRVRSLPGLEGLKITALHPGGAGAEPVVSRMEDGARIITVPLRRGCAMVTLSGR